jgi:hypothetical protein
MAAEPSGDAPRRDGATAPERTAAELGLIVGDQVRAAIDSAEQSAEELRRRALDDAAADRGHVHESAAVVLARIDAIEAHVARLLGGVRDEVVRIRDQAERTEDPTQAAEEPPSGSERPEPHPEGAAPRRRARRFGRRRRALPQCAVCGRAAEDGEEALERWRQVRRKSVCPGCQADGWEIPEGASVPYRSTRA